MRKKELRQEALQKRKAAYSLSASILICKRAASLPVFQKASTVMLYLPTKTEVDTSYLFSVCHRYGKKIYTPRVLDEKNMQAAFVDGTGFRQGAFGIWEPFGEAGNEIDLIFVPGVLFDKNGNRIGYGKGYYDRFLQNQNATTVGLAFSCQVVPSLPADAHDIRMDIVLTEEGSYS